MLFVPPTTRRPSVGFHFMHSGVARPMMSKNAHDTSLPAVRPADVVVRVLLPFVHRDGVLRVRAARREVLAVRGEGEEHDGRVVSAANGRDASAV
jgi:hypothetical protein